ncbi:MAG: cytochrome d ubiquinol oxidase subunit II [Actinomycetota bacterium]|nr:cytochrome d ubiquinol oxidase subunit II [Actinomycetota bacterium]
MSENTLRIVLLVEIGTGLVFYILLGGADFGGGIWDLLARNHTAERELIAGALGPVWEANHVWLIFVITGLFAAFPPAFADLSFALFVPLSIALAGIVLRGASFAFRTHAGSPRSVFSHWLTRVFGIASLVTPFMLGACAATIASGRIRVKAVRPTDSVVSSWISPISVFAGFLALSMCAFLAATYLTVEAQRTKKPALVGAFRTKAIASGVVSGVLALIGLVLVRSEAKVLWDGMVHKGWPLAVASAAGGAVSLVGLVRGRLNLARAGAAVAVASVVVGWGVSQWPYIIVPDVDAADAAASAGVLRPLAIASAVGGILLVPSLLILFRVFKLARDELP